MTKFTKSFLWRFILDIILLGIFVRFFQNIILTITSRFISTYSTPFLVIEAIVVSAISMLFICFITYWNIGVISKKDCYHNEEYSMVLRMIISEKWIHINSYDVCFDYNVKSVIILKQKIIVQLEIGDLYAVDMAGNIIERSDLDKDFIVEINQNNLYFNNSAVYFEHNIYSFVLFDDRIIVQLNELDASAKSDEIDNVYAVDMEGNIIWRIQNKERVCPEYKFISPYVMINYIDGELIVNDFNGFRFVFSPDDGTFVKRIQSLRPW